ncbi:hypothetical protein AAVH_17174, partial [Aphelenchoides avenae]
DHMKNKERGPCGQRNLACEHCDFRTTSMNILYKHMSKRKVRGNCFRRGLGPIFECVLCRFKTLRVNDMQNHIDRRRNGHCKPVKPREAGRRGELRNTPGRETIFVLDSIPARPSKHDAHDDIQ